MTTTHDERNRSKVRRRYSPPAVEETGTFERLVLGCLHLGGEPACVDLEDTAEDTAVNS